MSWFYGGLCMAVFLVRTMKRIIFHEARQYSAFTCRLLRVQSAFIEPVCAHAYIGFLRHVLFCAGLDSTAHNYVLLGLALLQFPLTYYLGIRPAIKK